MQRMHVVSFFCLVTCVGCGNKIEQFEGTWTYEGGSVEITCASYTDTYQVSGNVTFGLGTDSDLILLSQGGCNLEFNVEDELASVLPGQKCVFNGTTSYGDSYTETDTFTKYTFLLSDDGTKLSADGAVTVLLDFGGGDTVTCSLKESSTLSLVSP